MPDELLKVDSMKDNLIEQIRDLREKIDELERFALTSQDIVATSINCSGDIYTIEWTDYSTDSTIVGWSSYNYKHLSYKKIGKRVDIQVFLDGTSDNVGTTFTLPFTISNSISDLFVTVVAQIKDDGTAAVGLVQGAAGAATMTCYSTIGGGAWTDSGTKRVACQFCYEAA